MTIKTNLIIAAVALAIGLASYSNADDSVIAPQNGQYMMQQVINQEPLNELRHKVARAIQRYPHLYDQSDVEGFFNDVGITAASKFLAQRSMMVNRAVGLALETMSWRHRTGIGQMEATQFPCDLFKLGLIFESGQSHRQDTTTGTYVGGSPVIWIRLGALGKVVKHLESFTPQRLVSFAYNAPRSVLKKLRHVMRRERKIEYQARAEREHIIDDLSVKGENTVTHVLHGIAWWLNDWAVKHPGIKATLVLDFEGTDFAFASWSVGDFFVQLDDKFPDLFDQIIGFRYKPKLWSIHSPISMFNRIFKTRVSSSPETDGKLKFVAHEPQISAYMPRVDVRGYTMLPEHVAGYCVEPKLDAPNGCLENIVQGGKLYDPRFWEAIHNEFYQECKPKSREFNNGGMH